MKKILLKLFLTCLLAGVSVISYGMKWPKPPKGGHGNPGHHNAPFDGGVSLLIAAGVAYGAKKAYNKRKQVSN